LLIHQKISGHLLLGKWKKQGGKWVAQEKGALQTDPINQFLRVIFFLDNGFDMALSDLRKFAKIELWNRKELEEYLMKELGPDPLTIDFSNSKIFFLRKKEKSSKF